MTNIPCTTAREGALFDESNQKVNVESLPDSILLEVFNKLTFNVVCVVGRVCRRWYRVSRDPSLRRVVDVTPVSMSSKDIRRLLRHHLDSNVQQLYLRGFAFLLHSRSSKWRTPTLSPKTLECLGKTCTSLIALSVEDAFLADNTVTTRLNLLDFPSTLRRLVLRGCFFHPGEFFYPEPSGALPLLEVLDLSACLFVSSNDLLSFSRWTSLRVLGLESCHRVNDGGIDNLEPILHQLQTIDIEGTEVGDHGVAVLLKNCVKLQSLFLGHTGITGAAFMDVGGENRRSLTRVCLERTTVGEDSLLALAALAPELRWLVGSGPKVSEDTVGKVRLRLPRCEVLQFRRFTVGEVRCCGHLERSHYYRSDGKS